MAVLLAASPLDWETPEDDERLGRTVVGHRTRLAQEAPERWHDGEDQALARYLERSPAIDRTGAWLLALAPRGWLILGLLGLASSFVSGHGSPAALAMGLGGMLLAFRAFQKLATGMWHLAGAAIAWEQVAPLSTRRLAQRFAAHRPLLSCLCLRRIAKRRPIVIEAHELIFRDRDPGEPILAGA